MLNVSLGGGVCKDGCDHLRGLEGALRPQGLRYCQRFEEFSGVCPSYLAASGFHMGGGRIRGTPRAAQFEGSHGSNRLDVVWTG